MLQRTNPRKLAKAIESLTDAQADELLHDWEFWARREQLEPYGDWRVWLFLAGRGAGKSRAGAEWIRKRVRLGFNRIYLIAPTAADARDVMVEGESGILACSWSGDRDLNGELVGVPKYEPSKRRLTWKNGAQATAFSAEEPDRLRGPQGDSAWCDELAAWADPRATWDMMKFGLRLGDDPRAMVTTTPRPIPIIRELKDDEDSAVSRGNTYSNRANLAETFLKDIRDKYEGTRLGRQEIQAEILDDLPGALWTRQMLDDAKVRIEAGKRVRITEENLPDMVRVVVGVDPSGTKGLKPEELLKLDKPNDIGIVAAGLGTDGFAYVLQDRSVNLSPLAWGRVVCETYRRWKADRVIAEINFGGALVEVVIRATDPFISYETITASRGKVARAEPVAALYEKGRVKHLGDMAALEDQLCYFDPSGYLGEGSPDRADAMVWALTELMLGDKTYDGSLSWVGRSL